LPGAAAAQPPAPCDFQGGSPYWHPSPLPSTEERTLFDVYPGAEATRDRILKNGKRALPNRTLLGLGVMGIIEFENSEIYEFKDLCQARIFLNKAHEDHPESTGLPLDDDSKCKNALSLFLVSKPPITPRILAITGRQQDILQKQPPSPRCVDGLREGEWRLSNEDGKQEERVHYRMGKRYNPKLAPKRISNSLDLRLSDAVSIKEVRPRLNRRSSIKPTIGKNE
ncbi:MAG: hypothetical protein AAB425_05320, partial [Bdellovibrionota bacterium]